MYKTQVSYSLNSSEMLSEFNWYVTQTSGTQTDKLNTNQIFNEPHILVQLHILESRNTYIRIKQVQS